MESKPIIFEDWDQVLIASVPPDRRQAYREAIVKFRYWLKQTGALPDVEAFKKHLSWKQSYLSPGTFRAQARRTKMVLQRGTETYAGCHTETTRA